MRVPSYCFKSLENIYYFLYYFRMRVPRELQPILRRSELKKSLRTRDRTTAYRLCRQYTITAEKHFAELRLKLFQASLGGETEPPNLVHPQVPQIDAGPIPATIIHAPPRVEPEAITMSRLIELYIKEETNKRSHDIASGLDKNLLRFMEIVGDKPISCKLLADIVLYRVEGTVQRWSESLIIRSCS